MDQERVLRNDKSRKLREEILGKTREYYGLVHKPVQMAPFVEGQSRVNYAGRVFDEKEMVNLVNSSLEFWLTYGRYSAEFEKRLAGYLGVAGHVLSIQDRRQTFLPSWP